MVIKLAVRKEVPILTGSPADKAIIEPVDKAQSRIALKGLGISKLPKNVILCFFKDLYEVVRDEYNPAIHEYHDDFPICVFSYKGKDVAFLYPTMASYASMILEEVIALGGKNIIFIGGAGTLREDMSRGEVIVPSKAIRDEGVSYHYEKPSFFSFPSKSLIEKIKKTLKAKNIEYYEGATWTTSSFYRETEFKFEKFLEAGAICVEMEAASFFSIAKFRGVDIAGLFIAGDSISGKKWGSVKTPQNIQRIKSDREKLLSIALDSF